MGLGAARIPAVVTMHDVAWRTFPAMYHRWDRAIYDFKARYACREAQRIVAISEATKRDVCKFYNVKEEKVEAFISLLNNSSMRNSIKNWRIGN